jgi:hypothetical protein
MPNSQKNSDGAFFTLVLQKLQLPRIPGRPDVAVLPVRRSRPTQYAGADGVSRRVKMAIKIYILQISPEVKTEDMYMIICKILFYLMLQKFIAIFMQR